MASKTRDWLQPRNISLFLTRFSGPLLLLIAIAFFERYFFQYESYQWVSRITAPALLLVLVFITFTVNIWISLASGLLAWYYVSFVLTRYLPHLEAGQFQSRVILWFVLMVGVTFLVHFLKARSEKLLKTEIREKEQVAASLRQSEERIRSTNQDLEVKVAERTEALARALEQAKAANRLKDEFLATVSHELRTPLGVILGHSELLLEESMSESERITSLSTIRRNARAQSQIIGDLLDVSRIITGKMDLELKEVDLGGVIRTAIDSISIAASAKNIEVRLDLAPSPGGTVRGDSNRLQQILWNLLTNAVKFTPPGGQVQVRLQNQGDWAQLEVVDSGRGIEASFLPHVFERFRQEDASTTRQFGGLGLGLAIVRHLVEAHGGSVEAFSAGLDRGSKFTLRLPLAYATGASKPADSKKSWTEQKPLHPLRILVVEDEEDTRALLESILTKAGALITVVAGAEEAWQAFQRQNIDLLISDIGMPGQDGHELIARIRQLPNEVGGGIPAIALTAYARQEEKELSLAAGFDLHIAKPFIIEELIKKIYSFWQEHLNLNSSH